MRNEYFGEDRLATESTVKASLGMVSSSKKKDSATAVVEFKTILRVRPLLKKERDDPVALEALPCGTAVALHPPVVKDMAMTGVSDTNTTVVAGEDMEFSFDRVLSTSASQAKVYAVVGQPMALQAMESLKSNYTSTSSRGRDRLQSNNATAISSRRAHLIIGMGLASSGTTYTCLAGNTTGSSGTITTSSSSVGCTVSSKRKLETDGLVPRILDSLYSQSKHHPHPEAASSSKKVTFAVKITLLQVNQSKVNPSDCQIFDLVRQLKANSGNGGTTAVVSASAVVEQLGSNINSLAASFLSSMDLNVKKTPSAQKIVSRRRGNANTSYEALDEPVRITQDPVTSDCVVHNAIERTCTSPEEARATLQHALVHAKQLSMVHKKVQSHLWIQLTPVWIVTSSNSRGTTTRCQAGDTMAILDMASWEQPSKRTRTREEQSNRGSDAHTAVMHCLKAVQYNQQSVTTSPTSSDKRRALRKVPFLQHPVTMLVQPLLVHTSTVHLTLLVTASPSNRDYMEKKALLTEIMPYLHSNNVVVKLAPSTTEQVNIHQLSSQHKLPSLRESIQRNSRHPSSNPKRRSYGHASDAEDEASLERKRRSKPRRKEHLVSAYDASFILLNNELDTAADVEEEEVDDEPEDTFVGYDSGLLARDASKSILCVGGESQSIERKHSMSYSESTDERDDYDNPEENDPHGDESAPNGTLCTRPPPVAPGFRERILQHSKSSHLGSPAASAPIEDDISCSQPPPPILTVDFPGVVMPLPSTRSVLTEATTMVATTPIVSKKGSEMQSSSIPIDAADEISDDQPKFSYLKTINKVVHASKKKGRKVMERMTVTTIGSGDQNQVQQQIVELEMQNGALVRENTDLREQNQRLLEQLHHPMSNTMRTSAPTATTPDSPSGIQSPERSVSSFTFGPASDVLPHEKAIESGNDESARMNSPASSSTITKAVVNQPLKDRRNSLESCVPDQLYDNPMFRHMASMSNQPSRRFNGVTRRSYEKKGYNSEDTDGFSDDSSEENNMLDSFKAEVHEKTLFDDPLLQHMAMMNY